MRIYGWLSLGMALFLTRGLILNMSKVVGFTRCDFTNSIFEMDKLIFND